MTALHTLIDNKDFKGLAEFFRETPQAGVLKSAIEVFLDRWDEIRALAAEYPESGVDGEQKEVSFGGPHALVTSIKSRDYRLFDAFCQCIEEQEELRLSRLKHILNAINQLPIEDVEWLLEKTDEISKEEASV